MISANFCMYYNIEIVTCHTDQAGPKLVIFPEIIGVRYHAWIVLQFWRSERHYRSVNLKLLGVSDIVVTGRNVT